MTRRELLSPIPWRKMMVGVLLIGFMSCGIRARAQMNYADSVTAANPSIYYRLNEAAGTNAANAGQLGAAADGTYTNTGAITLGLAGPRAVDGFSGFADTNNSPAFAGAGSGHVDIPVSVLPLGNNTRTIEGWFNGTSSSSQNFLNYGPNVSGDRISVTAGNDRVAVAVSGHNFGVDGLGLSPGWHHFAVTLPGNPGGGAIQSNDWLFTIDGVDHTGSAITLAGGTVNVTTANTGNRRAGHDVGGQIDEVVVYHGALPVSTVQHHFRVAQGLETTAIAPMEEFTTAADNGQSPAAAGQFAGPLYIRERANENNPELEVEAFIRFSLDGIDGPVSNATLVLHEDNKLNNANSSDMYIARVLDDWDSVGNDPVFGETLVDGTDVADEFFFGDNGPASDGPAVDIDHFIDVTDYVNLWLSDPSSNFGVRLRMDEAFSAAAFSDTGADAPRLLIAQSAAAVPEPASLLVWTLIGVGSVLAFAWRCRK